MLSVVVDKPNSMAVCERPMPEPGPGEVRVRVRFAGICGSDLHIFHGMNPFVTYPRIIGHEFVGRIGAVGAGVDASRVGQTVVVDPVISCGQCHACKIGRQNVCSKLQVIGVHRDGGFSQYVCAPERNAYVVPAGLSHTSASIIEPFAVAANVTSRTGVLPSDIALIYGAGPVGLNLLQVLKKVYGVRAFITEMGAVYATADVIICRAGATTIAEVAAQGLPAIFVPYPHAADDHQRANAEALVRGGAARLVLDHQASGTRLAQEVRDLLGPPNLLAKMRHRMRQFARPDAANRVLAVIDDLVGNG